MKRIILIFLIFSLYGCATTLKGPISGKIYTSAFDQNYQKELVQARSKKVVNKYLKDHPETPFNIRMSMLNFRVIPGMTKDQITAVVGKPSSVTINPLDGNKETWRWKGDRKIPDTLYYFENGFYIRGETSIQKYIRDNPDIKPKIKQAIFEMKVIIGMNKEQVKLVMGKPRDINRTVTSYNTSEQWIYGSFGPYLYFDNNVLSSWQD